MRQRIVVRPVAQLDIEDVAVWYESQRKGLGRRFIADIGDLLDRIAANPEQFSIPIPALGTKRALMRRFPYAVYFAINEQCIAIIAALHQSRHPFLWKLHT